MYSLYRKFLCGHTDCKHKQASTQHCHTWEPSLPSHRPQLSKHAPRRLLVPVMKAGLLSHLPMLAQYLFKQQVAKEKERSAGWCSAHASVLCSEERWVRTRIDPGSAAWRCTHGQLLLRSWHLRPEDAHILQLAWQ
jgi:hypothetical protein